MDHEIKIKKPGKNAFYEARNSMIDSTLKKQPLIPGWRDWENPATKLLTSSTGSDQDSDGDGLTNLEERALAEIP